MNRPELPFDPKLKECAEEMKALLSKYEAGGVVVVSSRSHIEFFYMVPSQGGACNFRVGFAWEPSKSVTRPSATAYGLPPTDWCTIKIQPNGRVDIRVTDKSVVTHWVALEPRVLDHFLEYVRGLHDALRAKEQLMREANGE